MKKEVYFLTSNRKKAEDFSKFGVKIKEFHEELPEVLSPEVETVVLYKAKDTKLNNILVEDTCLEVEGADFYGTQIKHVYDEVKDDSNFHGKKAVWKVSVCMKADDKFYISTGVLEGILKYPALDIGYHFDRIFAVPKNENYITFELLPEEEKMKVSPRFQAISKMVEAIESGDYSKLKIIDEKDVLDWNGDYQIENTSKKYKIS